MTTPTGLRSEVDTGGQPSGPPPDARRAASRDNRAKLIAFGVIVALAIGVMVISVATDDRSDLDRAVGECVEAAEDRGASAEGAQAFCQTMVSNEAAAGEGSAPETTAAAAEPVVEPEVDATTDGVVPDVVGLDLQTAQDTLQAHGYRELRSIDDTGQGRDQIIDSNWIVVGMSPDSGSDTPVAYVITLFVVKEGEV